MPCEPNPLADHGQGHPFTCECLTGISIRREVTMQLCRSHWTNHNSNTYNARYDSFGLPAPRLSSLLSDRRALLRPSLPYCTGRRSVRHSCLRLFPLGLRIQPCFDIAVVECYATQTTLNSLMVWYLDPCAVPVKGSVRVAAHGIRRQVPRIVVSQVGGNAIV